MSPPRVTLRIGRIVVDGPCRSPATLRAAVEAELAALLAASGAVAPRGRAVERLAAPLRLEAPGDSALGRGIARATLRAVTGKASP